MKKLVYLTFILLMSLFMMKSKTYALNCSVDLQTSKLTFIKNEEFTVSVNLTNINSESGVIAFGTTIDYDKNNLLLLNITEKNNWSKPLYNENNGKLIIDKNGTTKNNETIFDMRFKVISEGMKNVKINLSDISIADGISPVKQLTLVSTDILINKKNQTPETNNNTNNNYHQSNNSDIILKPNSESNANNQNINNNTNNITDENNNLNKEQNNNNKNKLNKHNNKTHSKNNNLNENKVINNSDLIIPILIILTIIAIFIFAKFSNKYSK